MGARIESPSSEMVGRQDYKPWQLISEMARYHAIEIFMKFSGRLAITSPEHQTFRGGLEAAHRSGVDCSILISLCDSIAEQSPDLRGVSRKEVSQLLAPPKIIIPGAGTLGDPIEKDPGLIKKAWGFITGSRGRETYD